ncbi:MAG: demethoxyubiquinone hydroxylase family protein [Maricaulis sp.]|jgi:ubiquinone biosynthesis monooxygenase Coq7|nr:demethoxyubiquinone hydroxylase family protein [Maricaulis sp.]HAQ34445.1 demethoxyubiquinone hydroxylase family protein [Alphaproteobacteria bacterium]
MTDASLDEKFPLERMRRRILKVNHAGECGAIAIYGAQSWFAFVWDGELKTFLSEARRHEIGHRDRFRRAMRERGVSPCPGTALWVAGGCILGLVSVCGGKRGVYACTAAVERAVHGHLDEQIEFLAGRDDALMDVIGEIRIEEAVHMHEGEAGYNPNCQTAKGFTGFVSVVVEALIWLATFGDSQRLRRALPPTEPSRCTGRGSVT